ncbi:MAG: thioredoxin family protein [Spirulinaceae cyanobacterium]
MIVEPQISPIGQYAPDFELPGVDSQVHHLARYLEQFALVGVIFLSNQCQYVDLALPDLKEIQAQFQPRNFTLIGINPNDSQQVPEDSFEEMKNFANQNQLNFPYLRDPNQDVARGFQAQTTPEAFLIDKQGILRYTGGIKNNPESPDRVQKSYLYQAITTLLSGENLVTTSTKAIGSPLKWR